MGDSSTKKRKWSSKFGGDKLKSKKKSCPEGDLYFIPTTEEVEHDLDIEAADDDDVGNTGYEDDTGDVYVADTGYASDVEDEDDGDDDDDDGNVEKYVNRKITHGSHLVQGKMRHGMEDYIVAESRSVDNYELGLYAIFDGHSGREVAEHLQRHLFDNILSEPDFWTHPKSAVKRAYKITDDDILENVAGSRGGSTAVTAILVNGKKLIVANVGDSRAVLCRNRTAEALTVDHEPMKEKKQVESRGGFVVKMPGNVPRVDGQLAMTRAFGDGKVKEHITVEPDVVIKMKDEDTEFIILASDGLWKVMSNQEACDCLIHVKGAQEASEELTKEALLRESRDDISCIVVMFK